MSLRTRYLGVMMGSLLVAAALAGQAAADVKGPERFGKVDEGKPVDIYTLTNKNGMIARVMTLGATLVDLHVPDKNGTPANVVLGFDTAQDYQTDRNQYFGCTTGRVANRIAKGRFTLDGKEYQLAINNGPNHLHGGTKRPLAKVVWEFASLVEQGPDGSAVTFRYVSPDGEEGYPGTLRTHVTYALNERNELRIKYEATTDKATPISLTNHSYFNLAGAGAPTVLDHVLMVAADEYTPVDDTLIPTGKLEPVAGTPLDFRKPTRIGERIEQLIKTATLGYDHNFMLRPRQAEPTMAATLRDPTSGRVMTVRTTQPAIQVYSGNFLQGQTGRGGKTYAKRSALCLETHHVPNAVNEPAFPPVILRPGETYRHSCIYAFANE
jgi:aldose 1-epimerase